MCTCVRGAFGERDSTTAAAAAHNTHCPRPCLCTPSPLPSVYPRLHRYLWHYHRDEYAWSFWIPNARAGPEWAKREANASAAVGGASTDIFSLVNANNSVPIARPFIHWHHHGARMRPDVHMVIGASRCQGWRHGAALYGECCIPVPVTTARRWQARELALVAATTPPPLTGFCWAVRGAHELCEAASDVSRRHRGAGNFSALRSYHRDVFEFEFASWAKQTAGMLDAHKMHYARVRADVSAGLWSVDGLAAEVTAARAAELRSPSPLCSANESTAALRLFCV